MLLNSLIERSVCSVHIVTGGGVTLDLGIYAITMASLVFGGGRPESIQANGYLTDTGVDELASVTIKYPSKLSSAQNFRYIATCSYA